VLFDLIHADSPGIARLLRAVPVSIDNLVYVLRGQSVLFLTFLKMLGSVDEQEIVGLLASLEDQDADRDSGGVEEIGR